MIYIIKNKMNSKLYGKVFYKTVIKSILFINMHSIDNTIFYLIVIIITVT